MSGQQFRVIDDIPKSERKAFESYLRHKTRPINPDGSIGFYECDYVNFKGRCQ